MVRLTSWADPLVAEIARRTGIPREHLAVGLGGELLANVLEQVSGLFTKGLGKVAVDAVAGSIAVGYAVFGKDVPERLRRELLTVGSHLLLRILEAANYVEFKAQLDSFINALRTRGLAYAVSSMFATPGEVMAKLGLGTRGVAVATPPGRVAVTVVPPTATPAPTPTPSPRPTPKAF